MVKNKKATEQCVKKYYIKFNYITGGYSNIYFGDENNLNDSFQKLKKCLNDNFKFAFFGDTLINVDNVLAIERVVE